MIQSTAANLIPGILKPIPFTSLEFPRTCQLLEEGVRCKVAPGFVVGLWSAARPHDLLMGAFGNRRKVPTELPMTIETQFDLASLTKIFATTVLTAVLVERGWLNWTDPVGWYFSNGAYPNIQVHHLLSHTAGYPATAPLWEKIRAQLLDHYAIPLQAIPISKRQALTRHLLMEIKPETQPDVRVLYSDLSFMILGFLLETLLNMPLDLAVKRFVWEPMGFTHNFYHRIYVRHSFPGPVAATEQSEWRGGVLEGQVQDENCWVMGGYAGHAGTFAKVQDLLYFGIQLFQGFLSPKILKQMWTPYQGVPGCSRTLGWDTPSGEAPAVGKRFFQKSVGHLGYTGTSFWMDLEKQLIIVLLANRVHPVCDNIQIRAFRPQFHDALGQDLKLT